MMRTNIILDTDSYKPSHAKQYPAGTTQVYSYLESRGGANDSTTFFGLQYILQEYLAGVVVTQADIEEAQVFYDAHLGPGVFHRAGWQRIVDLHGGKLPLRIRAVPEGTVVPTGNVLMTIENTDPECYWLTNYVETILMRVWYPTTVATLSRQMKKLIANYLKETGGIEGLNFKLHDFGARGVSSRESAAIGGAAHLVNFQGSDTVQGIVLAQRHYQEPMAAFSIPAAEHSTITSWGKSAEADAYANMLTQYPSGLVAVVSDSYDIYNACANIWGDALKERVLGRDGVLVIRPDSGDPCEVLPKMLDILSEKFGHTINQQGYKVLNDKIRIIQGDGVNYEMARKILYTLQGLGWSAANLAFGMGGALLQNLNRDTQKFAIKCSHVVVNGEGRGVFKQPATEPWKKSKKGRMKLVKDGSSYATVAESAFPELPDVLETVFENGSVVRKQTFADIRARAAI